jgi:flagellar protein FlbB
MDTGGNVAGRGTIGRVVVLVILILLLAAGGLLWFDYLGIIESRSYFSPIYSLFGMDPRKGVSSLPSENGDLDADRIAKRLEAIDLRSQELDKKDTDLDRKEGEILQMSQELEDRLASVEERERTFAEMLKQTDDRAANIKQIAQYINGMPPQKAVDNLLAMDDQDIIDILRTVEAIAVKEAKTSSVAYWFSLMPPARAAEIQRKMSNKPSSLL